MNDLKIYPIKPDGTENKLKREIHPNLPNVANGACVLCVSPVRSGKSTLISNWLLSKSFYADIFDYVVIISNTIKNDRTSRFLLEKFPNTCYDRYTDKIITDIIKYQESFKKSEQPLFAIVLDDFIGIKNSSVIYKFVSRYRHYNCGLLMMATQNFKSVPPIVRNNNSHVLLGKITNMKELEKLSEEYGDSFGGDKNFRRLLANATEGKYNWAYLNFTENPPLMWKNFDEALWGHQAEKPAEYLNDSTSDCE